MSAEKTVVLTPRADTGLVWRESIQALELLGFSVHARDTETLSASGLRRLFFLAPERSALPAYPALFFSINFRGLDKHGESFSVLRTNGVPVAVWCVDNPWNLLSGLRADFWKEAHLFVTDASFIPGLKAHGARRVAHLPLAANVTTFASGAPPSPLPPTAPAVFVGRSAFPDKERFFIGLRVSEALRECAAAASARGTRPDFSWWLSKLDEPNTPLWPGSRARKASSGAEYSSLAWKTACLREAAISGLTIYGDTGWRNVFPADRQNSPELRPPVDYYVELRAIYAAAPFSLNMVSFLLPHGLNQRHFDTWAAGGFCLMDNSPGLALFPKELTEPVVFAAPKDIPDCISRFSRDENAKKQLAARWREHVLAEHTYAHRMRLLTVTAFG